MLLGYPVNNQCFGAKNLQPKSLSSKINFNSNFNNKKSHCSQKTRKNIHVIPALSEISNEKIQNHITLGTILFTSIAFLALEIENFLPKENVEAAKYSSKTLAQKISQVPVFAVTNSTGQPYLASNSKGEQVGLIFFSHEDAVKLLKGMQKTHQVLDARIYIMGLDKAYKMVSSNATPSGIKGNHGQELKMVFRFYPDQKELKAANSSVGITVLKEKFDGIPIFVADGLTVRKGKEDIIPIFFSKSDLENAWEVMCESNPDQAKKPDIRVGDLLDVIKKMEMKEMEEYGFFPSNESLEFVKSENKRFPSAKIHTNSIQKF